MHIKDAESLEISNCTFLENTGGIGGAVFVHNSKRKLTLASILQCQFAKNIAQCGQHCRGGALLLTGAIVSGRISACTFSENTAKVCLFLDI